MTPEFPVSNDAVARDVLTVSQLNAAVAQVLQETFGPAWVRGEVSNFTCAASGHWYFTLKDAGAAVRVVMFRSRAQAVGFVPRAGDRVEVRARASLYEARGDFQLQGEGMRRAGLGDLYEAFLRLKTQLEGEGLFEAERKRMPPALPRAIGVVTSRQAAALRDVLSALARRAPQVPIIVPRSACWPRCYPRLWPARGIGWHWLKPRWCIDVPIRCTCASERRCWHVAYRRRRDIRLRAVISVGPCWPPGWRDRIPPSRWHVVSPS